MMRIKLDKLITEKDAKKLKICPCAVEDGVFFIYVSDDHELDSIDFLDYLEQVQRKKIKKVLKPLSFIMNEISNFYSKNKKNPEDAHNVQTPLQLLFEQLIFEAEFDGCSDVHIEPANSYLIVRYRKDGVLKEVNRLNLSHHVPISNYIKLRALLDISESRVPQDGQIQLQWGNRAINCRVSCIPTIKGESFSIRILRDCIKTFDDFSKLSPLYESIAASIASKSYGLWLISGPTGSGKTTSFYAILSKFFRDNRQIVTFEDPVEHKLNLFTQINLGAGITSQNAARTVLRQSADIIGVGEIRNVDMLKLAVNAALTGHCVVATVHARNAESTMSRVKKFGVSESTLNSVVRGIMSQNFFKIQCENCLYSECSSACKCCSGTKISGRTLLVKWLHI